MSKKNYIEDFRDDLEHVINSSKQDLTYYFKKVDKQVEELIAENEELKSDLERAFDELDKSEKAYEAVYNDNEHLLEKIKKLESLPEIRGYVVATQTGILDE